MHKIFIGYDERQTVSFNVLQQSIIAQASEPVAIIPLKLDTLPIKRKGLTPFTFSRFLVPHLCDYEGFALFLDVDIVLNGDICELFKYVDKESYRIEFTKGDPGGNQRAVWVSKNDHRFEWASAMLFNCGHEANKILTPDFIEHAGGLHCICPMSGEENGKVGWLREEEVGDLPREWNHLVGYDKPRDDAKLIHYTQGVPAYPETIACEHSDLWHKWHKMTNYTQPWASLMGGSVHAAHVNGTPLPLFLFDQEKKCPKPEHIETVKKLLNAA